MPEASVDKNGEAEVGEHEVRFAEERPVAPPFGEAVGPENLDKAESGAPVS